jgi:hypothetical protein
MFRLVSKTTLHQTVRHDFAVLRIVVKTAVGNYHELVGVSRLFVAARWWHAWVHDPVDEVLATKIAVDAVLQGENDLLVDEVYVLLLPW